jgi:hypothetical protein
MSLQRVYEARIELKMNEMSAIAMQVHILTKPIGDDEHITPAIEQGRRGYTMQVAAALAASRYNDWQEVRRMFPRFKNGGPQPH